jgi:DNA-binding NtrC family response regulator
LPEPESADAHPTIPPPARLFRAPHQKLLIVDDFDPLLRSLRRVFEREGFTSVCESTCESALDAFEANPEEFLAVISDVSMPGMSGVEFARALHARRPDLPIVLMSGDEHVPETSSLGPRTMFLRKPFSGDAVIDWLGSILGQ